MIEKYKNKTSFIIVKNRQKWVGATSPNFGKWIISHKNPKFLIKFKGTLNQLVEEGKIKQVKFINAVESNKQKRGFLPKQKESVLLVYCWRGSKIKLKEILAKIGLKPKEWKSNLDTVIDRFPGGKLYEEIKKNLSKARFEKAKKNFVNIHYWNYEKNKLKKHLPKAKYKKIKQNFFKELTV